MKNIRYYIKTLLARYFLIVEFCGDCGKKQSLVWTAPDFLWIEVYGSEYGVLCPECFDKRCAKLGKFIRWTPEEEEFDEELSRLSKEELTKRVMELAGSRPNFGEDYDGEYCE